MKQFSLDLSKFKKHSEDMHTATLQHPAGHKITIAKSALTPKMREQLSQLKPHIDSKPKKMDDGGDVSDQSSLSNNGNTGKGLVQPTDTAATAKSFFDPPPTPQAKGGEIKKKKMDDGGSVSPQPSPSPTPSTGVDPDKAKQFKTGSGMYAKGGNIKQPDQKDLYIEPTTAQEDADNRPLDVVPDEDQNERPKQKYADGTLDIQPASDSEANDTSGEPDADESASTQPESPTPVSDQLAAQIAKMRGGMPQDPNASVVPNAGQVSGNDMQTPDLMHGYNQQMQGIQAEANAKSTQAQAQADALNEAAAKQQTLMNQFQKHFNDLDTERKAAIQDIKNHDIDPNAYWDNHSKLASTIGILIGGFNPAGKPNAGIQALQQQQQNELNAQAQNLGSRQNILAANLHQFGNLRDAMDMTRVMQNDYVVHKLQEAALNTTSPLAKAQAQQMSGQLEANMAPTFMQLALRRSLMNGGSQQPPAQSSQMGNQTKAAPPINYDKMNLMQMSGIMPKEDVEAATKEAAKLNETEATRKAYVNGFNQLDQKFAAGRLTPADRASVIWDMAGKIQHLAAGRFNMEDAVKQASGMFPEVGDFDSTRDDKIKNGNQFFDAEGAGTPTLDRYGLKNPIQEGSRMDVKTFGGQKYQRPKDNPKAKWSLMQG